MLPPSVTTAVTVMNVLLSVVVAGGRLADAKDEETGADKETGG